MPEPNISEIKDTKKAKGESVTSVPLLDLKRQYASIKKEVDETIAKVVTHAQFILGPEVKIFEESVASYCKTKFAIGVASGTDALLISLRACGVGPGDEVIIPTFSFFATAGVVHNLGAKPVFVDINPENYNLNPDLIQERITKKTKVIMPVHLFGQTCDMDRILDLAKKYNLKVVEDAAQALGAEYRNKKAGSLGDLGCFSFFPSKNLGGMGDGGMVVTSNPELAEKIKLLRTHGAKQKYYHDIVGYNSRLDTLQAAVLNVKLKCLDTWSKKRQENALVYNKNLKGMEITLPKAESYNNHIYNQYTIAVKTRDELKDFLKQKGIGCEIYYPVPLHLQKCFEYLGYKNGSCPVAEKRALEVISVPVFPELTEKEQNFVISAIKQFYQH